MLSTMLIRCGCEQVVVHAFPEKHPAEAGPVQSDGPLHADLMDPDVNVAVLVLMMLSALIRLMNRMKPQATAFVCAKLSLSLSCFSDSP